MSLTVEEVKENGDYNLKHAFAPFQTELGERQLANYKIALELGADLDDDWEDWADKVKQHVEELGK